MSRRSHKQGTKERAPDRRAERIWIVPLLVGLAALVLYLPATGIVSLSWDDPHDWLPSVSVPGQAFAYLNWDDEINFTRNPYVQSPTAANLWEIWRQPIQNLYIPVVYTSYWVEMKLWGAQAGVSHLVNALLHAANAVLVYVILRALLGGARGALLGALLFAIHPLQVEPVCWITGRKDLLCAFFSLVAIQQYVRWSSTQQTRAYAVAAVAFLLALASKPSAVTVPVIIAAIDVLLLHGPLRRTAAVLLPWLLVSGAWTLLTQRAQDVSEMPIAVPAVWQRCLVACDTLGFYAGKLVWPVEMIAVYGRTPDVVLANQYVVAMPLIVLVLAVVFIRGSGAVRAAIAIVVAGLLPVLGLVPFGYQWISNVADRYMYIPLFGVALAVGWAWRHWAAAPNAQNRTRVARVVVGVIAVALAVTTLRQQCFWRDSEALWSHSIAVNPDVATAQYNLGKEYSDREQPELAIPHYLHAVAVDPDYLRPRPNLGNDLLKMAARYKAAGDVEKALEAVREAIEHYNVFLDAVPDSGDVLLGLAQAYRLIMDIPNALKYYERALAVEGAPAGVHNDFGNLLFGMGQPDRAEEQYRISIGKDPTLQAPRDALQLLARVRRDLQEAKRLEEAGRAADARRIYEEVLKLAPYWRAVQEGLQRCRQIEDQRGR